MKLKSLIFFLTLAFGQLCLGQISKEDILFTVEGDSISAEEFVRVYNKNLDLVKDEKQKDIDEYLKLFVNYQLKLKEARRLELDKNAKYLREFKNYKRQLTKNYMSESKVTDELVKEAYDRVSYDVKASHILVKLDPSVKDTLSVYNKISDLRERAINEGFDKVKDEVHDGKNTFGESLGYFSGFKMVYDFETKAFNTKVGEISEPFRTQFGYHIVNVEDKRPSRGEVTVAHIMIALKQKDSTLNPEVRIKEINKKLQQGETFEALAKQFSDDKSSANKGGRLNPFKSGQLSSTVFEDQAFALLTENELSEPFKSEYGWHIVKLINKKGLQPFEEIKNELQSRVKRDGRSKLIDAALAKELLNKFTVTKHKESLEYFNTVLSEDYLKKSWAAPEGFEKDKPALTIDDKTYTYSDLANHLRNVQRLYFGKGYDVSTIVSKEYDAFLEKSILEYHKNNLEKTNPEFANILKEYRDGLLLFDLMEKQIWNKASKDTLGLQQFYNDNKKDYKWKERVDVIIASAAKKKDIRVIEKALSEGKSEEDIDDMLNSENEQKVIFTKGIKDTDDPILPSAFEVKKGISKVYNHNDAYHVLVVKEVLPESLKTFEEAKGRVINDYQNQIEDNWVKELKSRFKVEVDENVLNKVRTQIQTQ